MRLAIDSNILVLLVVGMAGRTWIAPHKRLDRYSTRDFDDVVHFVLQARSVVLLPHVLAETSNLATSDVGEISRGRILGVLANLIAKFGEHVVPSRTAIQENGYRWLGLTDAALLVAATAGATILSDDRNLQIAARRANLRVVTVDDLREQR